MNAVQCVFVTGKRAGCSLKKWFTVQNTAFMCVVLMIQRKLLVCKEKIIPTIIFSQGSMCKGL